MSLKIGQMVFHAVKRSDAQLQETGHYNNHLTVMPAVA